MSDMPPIPDAPPPMHPAPPNQWKPLSGLAVTAFVLSLLLILVALPMYWIAEAIPLVLGIIALVTVKAGEKRGRVLAGWAIVISLAIGSCSYTLHSTMRDMLSGTTESILSALSSKVTDEEKVKSLRSWAWPTALEKDAELPRTWMKRYDGVVAEFGPWQETFDMPSIIRGSAHLFVVPEGVVEVGTEDTKPSSWTMMSAFWLPAVFEKGIVYVVVVMQGGDEQGAKALGDVRPGEASPVVGDLRFYYVKGAKAEAGP